MIETINANPQDWKKECWIASKVDIDYDDDGNEIVIYGEPIRYEFNYQPISSSADLMEFGERAKIMQKSVISITYEDLFKEFDVAYLDGVTPEGEINFGDNANYRLDPPRNQNSVIQIYFERLTGK